MVFGKDAQHGGYTRSVACNNQWDQSRVETAGYAEKGDIHCKACQGPRGTLLHRHVYCRSMADLRGQFITEQDMAYYKQVGSSMLGNYGITMVRDLPDIPVAQATHEDQQILFEDRPLKFTGLTYVDGSLILVRMAPAAGRAGYSVVCMGEQYYDSDEDEAERPDPEVMERKCGCVNAKNPFHKCNQFCADTGVITTNEEGMEVFKTCDKSCNCLRNVQQF